MEAPEKQAAARPLLERLGLQRPELRAWALYDWANSAMVTVIVTAVFPIFFARVCAAGLEPGDATSRFSLATTLSLVVIAVLAPLLGAYADHAGVRKRLLVVFLCLGAGSVAGMFWLGHGTWLPALVLFGLANAGAMGSFVFYDSLLPHVARPSEVDRVSTSGYALGYLGGGLILALNLAWIQKPELFGLPSGAGLTDAQATLPTRLAFLSVAAWWLFFSLPLLRRVPEPPAEGRGAGSPSVMGSVRQLRDTFRELRRYRHAAWMILAFLLYGDGIQTIIRLAAIYGDEKNIATGTLIGAILLVQFVGVPCSLLFGRLARSIGAKRAILVAIAVYVVVALFAFRLETGRDFLVMALLVGAVQGGCQALSRSLFASMIPRAKSAEFFALFGVLERFAGFLGPALFLLVRSRTGSSSAGIGSIVFFFVAGALVLSRVDVEAGRRAAAEADADETARADARQTST